MRLRIDPAGCVAVRFLDGRRGMWCRRVSLHVRFGYDPRRGTIGKLANVPGHGRITIRSCRNIHEGGGATCERVQYAPAARALRRLTHPRRVRGRCRGARNGRCPATSRAQRNGNGILLDDDGDGGGVGNHMRRERPGGRRTGRPRSSTGQEHGPGRGLVVDLRAGGVSIFRVVQYPQRAVVRVMDHGWVKP